MYGRVLIDFVVDPAFVKCVQEEYEVININLVPEHLQPYVSAHWLVTEDLVSADLWLEQNWRGHAILIKRGIMSVPARCFRAVNLRQALRILHV